MSLRVKNLTLFLLLILCSFFYQCTNQNPSIPESFSIADGYSLTLVASEPLVKDPVDLQFDENNLAYVLEMPGYPNGDTKSRVVCLFDDNEDGIFDRSGLYAENLELASSIMPYKAGLLVAAPPYLLYIKDIDGDYEADLRDTLMSGFADGNLQHNFNGLTYGIDNWIYAANGGNNGSPYWWKDSTSITELRRNDIRFDPNSKQIQRIGRSSGGFEVSFDEWGHLYQTHNLHHISQLVFPSYYYQDNVLAVLHTLENISDHEENGLARIYPIGEQESRVNHPEQAGYFSGACGITYYGGGSLGTEMNQTAWVADVVLNLIHVDKLSVEGARMKSSRVFEKRDFIASADRSFRPVNMTVGPDGAMYIVDMYREVIEHPEWIPDEIEASLDLTNGSDKGRIYRVSTRKQYQPFETLNYRENESLVDGLNSKNQWLRMTAHRLLTENPRTDIPKEQLIELFEDGSNMGKVHSLWVQEHTGILDENILIQALQSNSAGLQENALVISESYLSNHKIAETAIGLLTDDNQRVRMQAALTISTIGADSAKMYERKIMRALLQASTLEMDQWNIAAITLAAKEFKLELFNQILRNKANSDQQELLESIAINIGGNANNSEMALMAIQNNSVDESLAQKIIKGLERQSKNVKNNIRLEAIISSIEKDAGDDLVTCLSSYRKTLGLKPSSRFLSLSRKALTNINQSNSIEDKLSKMKMLALLDYSEKSNVLFELLSTKEASSVQQESLYQLANAKDEEVGYRLVKSWADLGPQARRQASDILLYNEMHHDALLSGLEDDMINIGEMNFDLERRRTLLWWTDNDNTRSRAKALFSDTGVFNRKDVIDKMKDALALSGSADQGNELFISQCGQCHLYGTVGVDVGPVLTESNRKSKESLLYDILDPNAACETKYINHKLETIEGELHIGIVDVETDSDITIKKMGGTLITVNKNEIKSLTSLGSSMMPEGLEANLDHQQMADLLSYLLQAES